MESLILKHIDTWTAATYRKTAGRGNSVSNIQLTGIQKLRELILELAVRGKLVQQDPNDEPASELLKKIEVEKKRLIKEGIIKKQDIISKVNEDDKPYDLPSGWVWTKIRSVGHDWGQKTPNTDFTYIEVSAIDNSKGIVATPTILPANEAPSRARKIVKLGTVIYSTVRPYLKNICVISENFAPEPIASTAFAIIHPFLQIPGKYFLLYFQSPIFVRYVESVQNGIAYPAINDKQFFGGIIPLPPLAEQHRIVAKVDELMALCDLLEKEQSQQLEAHETLVDTLLTTLTRATDAAEFRAMWLRIEENFEILFTTENSVDKLKQTILQLAVMGKLVPQNPNDEPASELLKKIAAEKARLVKEGKIKKQAALPEITEEEKPFELPKGWEWVRLGNTGIGATGKTPSTNVQSYFDGDIPFVGPGQIIPSGEILEPDKFLSEDGALQSTIAIMGDILMVCIGGSIGKSAIVKKRVAYNQQLNSIRPFIIDTNYIYLSLNSPQFQRSIVEKATGSATPIINRRKWEELLIPIPPIIEQQRIVYIVHELFALCDSLKERIRKAQEIQNTLAEEIVKRVVRQNRYNHKIL